MNDIAGRRDKIGKDKLLDFKAYRGKERKEGEDEKTTVTKGTRESRVT